MQDITAQGPSDPTAVSYRSPQGYGSVEADRGNKIEQATQTAVFTDSLGIFTKRVTRCNVGDYAKSEVVETTKQ